MSLSDRITNPSTSTSSWADEPEAVDSAAAPQAPSSEVSNAQTDGASEGQFGGVLQEPMEYDVNVKLANESSPLLSVKTFEELGLLVARLFST